MKLSAEEQCDDDDSEYGTCLSEDLTGTRGYLCALMERMEIMTYSTAFSGIDSPGTSFAQLRVAAWAALHPDGVPAQPAHPEHVHAIAAGLCYMFRVPVYEHEITTHV